MIVIMIMIMIIIIIIIIIINIIIYFLFINYLFLVDIMNICTNSLLTEKTNKSQSTSVF